MWPEEDSFPKAQYSQACHPVDQEDSRKNMDWQNGTFRTSLRCIVIRGSHVNILSMHHSLGLDAYMVDALSHRWVSRYPLPRSSSFICSLFHHLTIQFLSQASVLQALCFCLGHVLLISVLAELSWIAFSLAGLPSATFRVRRQSCQFIETQVLSLCFLSRHCYLKLNL